MTRFLAILPICLALAGCASPQGPTVGGIKNFRWLDRARGICAGAQPDMVSVSWLVNNGVTNTIKLNGGHDPRVSGMVVKEIPVSTWLQIWGGKRLAAKLDAAEQAITPGTFFHCKFGRNRTGTVEIGWRVKACSWGKPSAIAEANSYGWGNSLPGLKAYVRKLPEYEHPSSFWNQRNPWQQAKEIAERKALNEHHAAQVKHDLHRRTVAQMRESRTNQPGFLLPPKQ